MNILKYLNICTINYTVIFHVFPVGGTHGKWSTEWKLGVRCCEGVSGGYVETSGQNTRFRPGLSKY